TPSAQDTLISVTGLVSDTAGAPLPGVSVLLKGMNRGTATDLEGRFSLENINPNGVLVLSFLGYRNLEIPLEGRTAIQAVMKADVAGLDEVVVVGYGTTRKSDLTGSVASIKGEDIAQNSMGSFESLLQGRVSGLQIMNRNNDNPQGGTTVRIRGVSSINGSNAPLVVVDGIPLGTAGGINAVNPAIISSIEVLKDASATAIYGSRGANGVIMITTKRGETGRASIWLNQKTNFTSFSDNLDYWRDVNKMVL